MGQTDIPSVGVARATKHNLVSKGSTNRQQLGLFFFPHKCFLQRMLPVTSGNWAAEMQNDMLKVQ